MSNETAKCNDQPATERSCPDPAGYTSRFWNRQPVKIPLGDGTYQECEYIGTDKDGVSTVKTKDGRYKIVWDENLYSV